MKILRLFKIITVSVRFGLDEFFLGHERFRALRFLIQLLLFWRRLDKPRAERLRLALEALGPIFVKFGQMLSTRRDLLPLDIADELAKLQDQVPPFASEQVLLSLARVYGKPADQVFLKFDPLPVASASVAQVHFAVLQDGKEAAVKILRPGIASIITKDLALLDIGAGLIEALWEDGKRLRPREVVAEFEKHLHDELDLMREAANASQLRRNFEGSNALELAMNCVGKPLNCCCFGKPREPFEEHMTAREECNQKSRQHNVLADQHLPNLGSNSLKLIGVLENLFLNSLYINTHGSSEPLIT